LRFVLVFERKNPSRRRPVGQRREGFWTLKTSVS